jgi:hypothetical protein
MKSSRALCWVADWPLMSILTSINSDLGCHCGVALLTVAQFVRLFHAARVWRIHFQSEMHLGLSCSSIAESVFEQLVTCLKGREDFSGLFA